MGWVGRAVNLTALAGGRRRWEGERNWGATGITAVALFVHGPKATRAHVSGRHMGGTIRYGTGAGARPLRGKVVAEDIAGRPRRRYLLGVRTARHLAVEAWVETAPGHQGLRIRLWKRGE